MEAACKRLCQGDTSSLPDIIDCVESGIAPPAGRTATKVYNVLTALLIREGRTMRDAETQDPLGPNPEAFNAMRILAVLGVRHRDEGYAVKSVLLALGLQRCRDMCLDCYFLFSRWQRYYVVMFVYLLMGVFGCRPHDLLRNSNSLTFLTGVPESDRATPLQPPPIEATERTPARPHSPARAAAPPATGGSNGAPSSNTVTPRPPATGTSASPSRHRSGHSRNNVLISIPGTSADLPLHPTRWYREMPRKAVNAPFPVNPLYVNPSPHGPGDGSPAPTEHVAEDAASRHTVGVVVPEIPMTAQFPTPVLLFTAYHGVGCVPRLPTTEDLARLEAWRDRRHGQVEVRSGRGTPPPMLPPVTRFYGFGSMLEVAMQLRERVESPGAAMDADDGGPQACLIRNERAYSAANTDAAVYHRRCLDSLLLRQYLEQGELLSWGSSASGALGPRRQRHTRQALEPARGTAGGNDHSAGRASPHGGSPTLRGAKKSPTTTALAPLTSNHEAPAARRGGTEAQTSSVATALAATDADCGDALTFAYLPLPVATTLRVAQVSCGLAVTYALTVDGTLYSCGRADHGQLGIGERSVRYAETGSSKLQRVLLRGEDRVNRIVAGTASTAAVAADNALYCWGHNVYGQCFKMPDASRVLTPVRLRAGGFKVLDICYGQSFGLLLFDDGVLGTWGISSMLGCSMKGKTLETSLAPDQSKCARQVVHLQLSPPTPMAAVRAGTWHALAISQGGEVFTWGSGRNGRLGHGTDASESRPRLVEGLRSCFAVDASCSNAHTAVLTSTGAVYVFGENAEGQLGLRGSAARRLPTMLVLPSKAVAVACAREHTCILLEDGDVVACGSYRTCGIGLGYGRRLCAPVRILTNYVTLTLHASQLHSMACIVHRCTAVMVVGHSSIDEVSRVSSLVVRNGVRCAASGAGFLIVLSENNSLVAIGRGDRGQLGIGDCMRPTHKEDVPVAATFGAVCLPPDVAIQHIRCGPDFTIAIDAEGLVYGWGSNAYHKLCQPITVSNLFAPVRLTAYGEHRVVQVACGVSFVVALTSNGDVLTHGEAVYCGLGTPPPKGPGYVAAVAVPTRVPGLRDIVAVAAGRRHALAMTASCGVFAWGLGVLGTASTAGAATAECLTAVTPYPVRVTLSQTIRSIGCGAHNSFAISDEGELWVWGMNRYGECGVPTNGGTTSTTAGTTSTTAGSGASNSATGAAAPAGATPAGATPASGTRRESEPPSDRASAITTPTSVARHVRDAAFTSCFGVVVFEDGQVRVSGRIRHGGQRYLLPSFHSSPQPVFSVNVNEPAPRDAPPTSTASAVPRDSGAGGDDNTRSAAAAPAATASAPRPPPPPTVTEVGAVLPEEEEEEEDGTSNASSSANFQAEAPTTSAALPTDGQHTRHPDPPSPTRTSPATPERVLLPRVDVRRPATHRATTNGGRISPWNHRGSPQRPPSNSVAVAGPPISLAVRATESVSPFLSMHDSLSNLLLPSLSGFQPSTSDSVQQPTTAATAGPRSSGGSRSDEGWEMYRGDGESGGSLNSAGAYFYNSELSSPPAPPPLANAAAPSDANAFLPMTTHRTNDRGAATAVRSRTTAAPPNRNAASAATGPSPTGEPPLPVAQRPSRSHPHSAGAGSTAAPAAAESTGDGRTVAPPPGRGTGTPAAPSQPLQGTERPPEPRSPRPDGAPVRQTPPQPQPLPPPAPVVGEHIFGLRCFAGWEQICVVMEKRRPSAKEVCMAQTGLQVLLRQPENSTRDV